jgi:hypothetical protein
MKYLKLHNGRRAKVDEDFTKLTDAERAEFIELLRDSFDPELYEEDDLPMLRANKKKFEEEQQREEGSPALESSSEEWEPDGWSSDYSHSE